MTVLPSFVQLMESLGIEQQSCPSSPDLSSSSPSPPSSPQQTACNKAPSSSPAKSRSSPSLRELSSSRSRFSRYSPYSTSCPRRQGSSSPSSSEYELTTKDSSSPPPTMPSSFRARRPRNQLTINICGSVSDLPAYTPISTYVRRKTPGASPTSPIFPRQSYYDSVDITLPMLPDVLPSSASTDSSCSSFPPTPTSPGAPAVQKDMTMDHTDLSSSSSNSNNNNNIKSPKALRRWHTGVRISTPPFTSGFEDGKRRRVVTHFT